MKGAIKNQSIYLKSLIAPAILILTLCTITALFIISTKNQQKSFHTIREISTNRMALLEELLLKTEKIQSGVFHISAFKYMNSPANEIDELLNELEQDISNLKIILDRIPYQWTLDKYEKNLVKGLQTPKELFIQNAVGASLTVIKNPAFGAAQVRSLTEPYNQFVDMLRDFISYQKSKIQVTEQKSLATTKTIINFVYGILILVISLGLLTSLHISKYHIAKPINKLTTTMLGIASGNHEIKIASSDRQDEIGEMIRAAKIFKKSLIDNEKLKDRMIQAQKLSHLGYWDWILETNSIEWSREIYKIFGHDPEKFSPNVDSLESTIHPEDYEQFVNERESALRQKRDVDIEQRIIRPDGSIRYIHGLSTLIKNRQGNVIRIAGTVQDITDKKNIEEALRRSEKKYKNLVEKSNDIIWTTDLNFKTDYVSSAVTSKLGYSVEERLNQSIQEQMTEQSYNAAEEAIVYELEQEQKLAVDPNRTMAMEIEYFHKDGHTIWFENLVSWKRDKYNSIIGIHGVSRDISARKSAEKKLKESEEFHREFFENSPTALSLQDFSEAEQYLNSIKNKGIKDLHKYFHDHPNDADHLASSIRIKQINKAAIDLYKAKNSDELINSFNKILLPRRKTHIIEQVIKFYEGSNWYENSAKNLDLKGDTLDIVLRNVVINREVNGLSKILVSIVDVTDLHQIHQEKQNLEKKLFQSQKMESIGTLAGGIAHDFNNILTSIIGFTQLALSEAPKNSELKDDLEEVYTAGKRAKDLVKQILTFARETDEEVKPVRVDILAKEVVKFIRSSLPATIQINDRINSHSLILGSDIHIHQVLMNLCTNAAQAMETNGGTLDIELKDLKIHSDKEYNKNPDSYIQIKISDTGEGIAEKHIHSIFDPYFTTKSIGKGTGMGLSVVHGIIESYNGTINVKSKQNHGTTVTILLPATEKRKAKEEPEVNTIPQGNERILFVDDEPAIIKMGRRMLFQLGYSVTIVGNSIEALELFKSNPDNFDLLITDMTMPQMTGDVLAEKIQGIRPGFPIILCTGYSKILSDNTISRKGINAIVHKPVTQSDLAKTIRKILDTK